MSIPQKHQTLASNFLIQLRRRSFSVLLAFSFSVFPPTIRVSVNGLDVVVRLFASFLVLELFLVSVISQYYSPNGSVHRRCSCLVHYADSNVFSVVVSFSRSPVLISSDEHSKFLFWQVPTVSSTLITEVHTPHAFFVFSDHLASEYTSNILEAFSPFALELFQSILSPTTKSLQTPRYEKSRISLSLKAVLLPHFFVCRLFACRLSRIVSVLLLFSGRFILFLWQFWEPFFSCTLPFLFLLIVL